MRPPRKRYPAGLVSNGLMIASVYDPVRRQGDARMLHRWLRQLTLAAPYLIIAAGVISVVLFGLVGIGRGALAWQLDLQTLYGSGWKIARGIVPYGPPETPAEVAAQGVQVWLYAYPPSFAPIAMGLAALGWTGAKALTVLINILASAGIAAGVALMMRRERADAILAPEQIAVAGVILVSPFIAHVLWLGNTTLVVLAALLFAWRANDAGRQVIAGLLMSVVAIKPQFALLPGLWLLMERRWALVASAAAGSLALSFYPMSVFGPVGAFTQWIEGLWTYLAGGENAPGCLYCFGIGDTLAAGHLPAYNIEVMAVLSAALLWRLRDRLTRLEILALLMGLTAFFLPVHNYDLVILAPMAGAIGVLAATSAPRAIAALAAAALFFVPLRLVQLVGSAMLLRWRELILFVLMATLVSAALRRSSTAAPAKDVAAGA